MKVASVYISNVFHLLSSRQISVLIKVSVKIFVKLIKEIVTEMFEVKISLVGMFTCKILVISCLIHNLKAANNRRSSYKFVR